MSESLDLYPYAVYVEGLKSRELRYQHCDACSRSIFPPRVLCPSCASTELSWRVSSGRGVVYSATTIERRDGSYNVALVDVDEGFRMMSRVDGYPEAEIPIGLAVTCAWRPAQEADAYLPVFEHRGGSDD
ncbi:Zn-ribbon domain-containing OB-fold protein [Blastococcus saxobsidens]|uniref:DNA-binding protein n=1 Tax=Blastococcus saxobsidens (strain DD2) TaxID=1146883 RepID=H6RSZ8_BLASD|nr:OB-fold domain-containing protein [Blastococcus saxobsidens]CCG04301.1 conserved protein of unknown function; putative Zn-ribbon nucleic-acid-binding domain [Blastococcus saxobsidens DD2]